MKIYPRPGLLLRDPVKRDVVPAEGREVTESVYWRRRIAAGDATLTAPKEITPEPAAAPAAAASPPAPDKVVAKVTATTETTPGAAQ